MSNLHQIQFVKDVRTRLDEVSPAFCLAKWTQSTIYLWNGHTHSCHHPGTHKIPVEGLDENPAQLHNTPTKQALRLDMINGKKVAECEYCWNVEALSADYLSDRHTKSALSWSEPHFNEVLASGGGAQFAPRYVEIAFETTCQFKCTYCFPHVSSRVNEEIVTHGSYKLPNGEELHNLDYIKSIGQYPIDRKQHNPYLEAFWKWWPTLYQNVDVFRITGGEPLLSTSTWAVMDYMIEHPRPGFDFAINTNFGLDGKLLQKLIDKVRRLTELGVKVSIYTSLESMGRQAEYARFGLDAEAFKTNVNRVLDSLPSTVLVTFMTTINILSVPTFEEFLQYIFDLRVQYNQNGHESRIGCSFNYIRYPEFLALPNLPHHIKQTYADKWLSFMRTHLIGNKYHPVARFYLEELNGMERMCDWMMNTEFWKHHDLNYQRQAFKMYHEQYDQRRGTNFAETFPELIELIK